jgi:simple sugar transport system ATP-binding protein
VDLTHQRGEVHCLLGENGAGKSTLVSTIFGLYQPDAGQILVDGEPVRFRSSADAIARGIGMVHQHFQLIPVFSVTENVVLGDEVRRGPLLDLRTARARIVELTRRFGLEVDPDARVGDLSIGEQQRVELIKALYRDADILILDEPTAVLTPGEVDDLFEVVRSLVAAGKSIIFITHKLREVLALADRITVLRGGRVVDEARAADATPQTLATAMVGRDVSFSIEPGPPTPGAPVLVVDGLVVDDDRGSTSVDGLHLEVRSGEILGIAGVEGNGQRELVEAITGMRTPRAGRIVIDGHDVSRARPREVIDLGVGHVPEDRTKHGVVGPFSVADNLVLNRFRRAPFARRGLRDQGAIDRRAAELVERFDIRTAGPHGGLATNSAGNLQEVIIARELGGAPKLRVVAQPTRGLVVGSVEFIHREIVRRRDEGAAVLLVSAELDEVLSLADRVGVMYRGRLVGTFDRGAAARERIGMLMACGTDEAAS